MRISPPASPLERPGRLNEALIRQGAKAITTDATGSIDLGMLIDEMRNMGMTFRDSVRYSNGHHNQDAIGLYLAIFTQQGAQRGDDPVEASASAVSREAAIVAAAMSALVVRSSR